MIILVYWILGYISYGYVNSDKVYVYSFGRLFIHKAIIGLLLGWWYIIIAVFKLLIEKK
jgi:hypothetical protein